MWGNIRQPHPVVEPPLKAADRLPILARLVSEHVYLSVAVVKTYSISERMNARRHINESPSPRLIHVQHAVVNARLVFIRHQPGLRGRAHFGLFEIDGPDGTAGARRRVSHSIALAKARAGHE